MGLTCDPVGGIAQMLASVKAINAARMAMHGDGARYVAWDKVISGRKHR